MRRIGRNTINQAIYQFRMLIVRFHQLVSTMIESESLTLLESFFADKVNSKDTFDCQFH